MKRKTEKKKIVIKAKTGCWFVIGLRNITSWKKGILVATYY